MKTAEQIAEKWADEVGAETAYREKMLVQALKEYGEAVRDRAAGVCESRYMGDNNREDMEAKRCAAAIERMELP